MVGRHLKSKVNRDLMFHHSSAGQSLEVYDCALQRKPVPNTWRRASEAPLASRSPSLAVNRWVARVCGRFPDGACPRPRDRIRTGTATALPLQSRYASLRPVMSPGRWFAEGAAHTLRLSASAAQRHADAGGKNDSDFLDRLILGMKPTPPPPTPCSSRHGLSRVRSP